MWASSSAGRARRSQRRGRGFESHLVHHSIPFILNDFQARIFACQRRAKSPEIRACLPALHLAYCFQTIVWNSPGISAASTGPTHLQDFGRNRVAEAMRAGALDAVRSERIGEGPGHVTNHRQTRSVPAYRDARKARISGPPKRERRLDGRDVRTRQRVPAFTKPRKLASESP